MNSVSSAIRPLARAASRELVRSGASAALALTALLPAAATARRRGCRPACARDVGSVRAHPARRFRAGGVDRVESCARRRTCSGTRTGPRPCAISRSQLGHGREHARVVGRQDRRPGARPARSASRSASPTRPPPHSARRPGGRAGRRSRAAALRPAARRRSPASLTRSAIAVRSALSGSASTATSVSAIVAPPSSGSARPRLAAESPARAQARERRERDRAERAASVIHHTPERPYSRRST